MIKDKYCIGCHDNYYNPGCWSKKTGKVVWRIRVGMWESPPYLHKKKIRVADCWHGSGNQRDIMVKPESIGADGYWKH
jgi:hypothetical protein